MEQIPVREGDVPTLEGVNVLFGNIVSVILSITGLVLFVVLILSGIKFLTSGGDPKKLESAKGSLSSALLGMVLLVCAFLILKLIGSIFGIDLTTFDILIN